MKVKRISSHGVCLGGRVFLIVLGVLSIAAVAAAQTHTITASAGVGGSISPSGDVPVADGADQSFTIASATGYHVSDVLVDGASQGAILGYAFINVTEDHTIEVQFAANAPVFVTDVDTVNIPEGGTASLQVRLSEQPTGDVNAGVTRASGDANTTVQSGASLTFTYLNWDTYQAVTLAAAEDADKANGTALIRVAASGIPNKDVTATEQGNDTLQFVTSTSAVNVPEGSTATFQVRLSAQPSKRVNATVTRVSGDTDITVRSGARLTFTRANWGVNQTVTLAAAEDVDTTNGTAAIRISGTGLQNKDLTATEQDNDEDNGTIALILSPAQSTAGLYVEAAIEISDNPQQVGVFGLDLVYDEAWFAYKSKAAGTLTGNWTNTVDASTAGRLKIRGVGGTIIPIGSPGSLVKISFQVNCLTYTVPTVSQLSLENYTDDLFDDFLPLPSTANFTFAPCARLGDVNGDENITPGDAQLAFEIYLGIWTPTFCQEMTSDGNCSGSTTPGDAQNIFEHYLGRITLPGCCALAASSSLLAAYPTSSLPLEEVRKPRRDRGARPPEFSRNGDDTENRGNDSRFRRALYALDTIGRPGDIVSVPVIVSNPRGLRSFEWDVIYPFDVLEYLEARRTSLTQGFDYILGTEEAPGLVRIEAESHEAIASRELGGLVLLMFRVREGADIDLPIQVLNPTKDLRDAEIGEGMFIRSGSVGMDPKWVSLGSPVSAGESLVRVPVLLNDLFGLKAFGFEVNYERKSASFVEIRRPGSDDGRIDLQAREVDPGRVRVGGYRMRPDLRREPGVLVELVFRRNGPGAAISLDALVDDLAKAMVTRGNVRLE